MDNLTKQTRTGARNNLAETLAKWAEINNDPKTKTRKAPAKGSTKGCVEGKGGPENNRCSFRGVRQRTWGKWVAEIRQPNQPQKLWLGTFDSAVEAAVAYDKAARTIYGSYAILNLPDYSPNDQSLLCKTASTCGSTFNCSQSESSQVRESKTAQNVCEASAGEVDANVTGISNDDDMIDIDELLSGMDKKVESINEAGSSSQPMCDAWFENKADDYDFDFGFLETGSEECNFTLDELCR